MKIYLDNCCFNRPFRQFEVGTGNYTEEREQLLAGISFDEIVKTVRELDAQHG